MEREVLLCNTSLIAENLDWRRSPRPEFATAIDADGQRSSVQLSKVQIELATQQVSVSFFLPSLPLQTLFVSVEFGFVLTSDRSV